MTATQLPNDGELVARAKDGDFDAFEGLVSRHERVLYAVAMRILRQREDAEDVVQNAFLSALEKLDGFRGEASFGTWINRITVYGALKVLRKRRGLPALPTGTRADEDEEGDIRHPEFIADWRDDPAEIAEQRELRGILDEVIESLPEKHRLVFVLRDVVEMSIRETAEALGISEANVKVRLLRARLALREQLTRRFGDENKRLVKAHRHEGDEKGVTPAQELLMSYRRN